MSTLEEVRDHLRGLVSERQDLTIDSDTSLDVRALHRDCARSWRSVLDPSSELKTDFSVARALWDLARTIARPDLSPGFFANLMHLFRGLHGQPDFRLLDDCIQTASSPVDSCSPRAIAIQRSNELDGLWEHVSQSMARYPHGLSEEAKERRTRRRDAVMKQLGVGAEQWNDWQWQIQHVLSDADSVSQCVHLREHEYRAIQEARRGHVPFGLTPYTASLLDDAPELGRDRAIRAQVFPPNDTVQRTRCADTQALDFMRESETSPIELVTRRYPGIVVFKPFHTCPQICVYCQRNWEIQDAMSAGALASEDAIDRAIDWIAQHPAVNEVLLTGGDPLAMQPAPLASILRKLAAIPHIDLLRIGTRTLVTLPMRFDEELLDTLSAFRKPGERELCVVTHIEHVYELSPELVDAVEKLRRRGLSVYNQHVLNFFVSRRFETAALRMMLKRIGIDPYYTFLPKGKDETRLYQIPLARALQELKEEARLLPGMRRTDETVYNVPALGKNALRAYQHRDLLTVLPDGRRVYEFHPWEKMIAQREPYVGTDLSIYDYLCRLRDAGEDPAEYQSIWYYF
ncbi:MAG: KamA family radical SAM protein [Myxococcota bacterium]|nr:KamA family radical SAM protein [Myxococcota bacterium]